jgi:hypothetical protein
LTGIPESSPSFDKFLESLPADDGWDSDDQFQKGYKAAGLKRYRVDAKSALQEGSTSVEEKEKTTIQGDMTKQKALMEDPSRNLQVKIEVPEYVLLGVEMKVVKSAEGVIGKLLIEIKKLHAQLFVSTKESCQSLSL